MTSNGSALRHGARSFVRDWRAGELRLLMLALVVAVAASTSVGFFIDRLRGGLERDAAQLLGADLVIVADRPTGATLRDSARGAGLADAETVIFPSMASAVASTADGGAGDDAPTQLVAVKAASERYPLRGALRTASGPGVPDQDASGLPEPGTVWVDAALLPALHVAIGDSIGLGDRRFRIARLITLEPDRGVSFVNLSPRVLMRLEDLPATNLISTGSRASYRLLVAGTSTQVAAYRSSLDGRLERGQHIESLETGRPEVRTTLDRAQRFLTLVALSTAMLAALAVALAARRFTERHLDTTAVIRCIGVSQGMLLLGFLAEFAIIGAIGSAVGALVGYLTHFVFIALFGALLQSNLPQPSAWPALQGLAIGLVLLAGFALPPVVQLRHVAPIRVFRRDVGLPRGSTVLGYALGLAAFAALTVWSAGDVKVGAITLGGFAAATVIFTGAAFVVLRSLAQARHGTRMDASWRFALASMQRRPLNTIVQTVALAIGLMALLLLSVTRSDLVAAWRRTVPPDAPNRFVINVQPDQRTEFAAALRSAGVANFDLAPMVRGRLVAIDGKPVDVAHYEGDQARRLVDREFNLSYTSDLPAHNTVESGKWFAPDAVDEVSIEAGIAKTLGVKLGDRLRFDIAGVLAEGRITSIRKLDWDSMRVNFFVVFPPAALSSMAQSWISAFHLPEEGMTGAAANAATVAANAGTGATATTGAVTAATNEPTPVPTNAATNAATTSRLVQRFPNITIIDTGAIFRQVQSIVDQVVQAVEFLFLFTLVAGVLVLYAALLSSRDERTREAALLRALGASRKQLARAQLAEFAGIGLIAGILAAAGATATGWALATRAFDFPYRFGATAWVLGIVGGVALAVAGGWFGLRPVMNEPPLKTLREG